VIPQFDNSVGAILKTLDRLKLAENTLVILSSDNGPVVDDGSKDDAVEKLDGHKPAGPWRGGKYSIFEGGTRVPFIVRRPGHVKPGVTDALVCEVDFVASFAAMTGQALGPADAPDSFNVLPALLGVSATGRADMAEQAGSLGLRRGSWKYIEPNKGAKVNRFTNTELGNDPAGQIYDLTDDRGERKNLLPRQSQRAEEMGKTLRQVRGSGRTRP
jgi:arylsulfatase A-like enzyme